MTSCNHLMLDIETLDTKPTAIVLSIGAIIFDPNSSELSDRMYAVLNQHDQRMKNRTESLETLAWWRGQSDEAKAVLSGSRDPTYDTLLLLADWIKAHEITAVWGNGVGFDNVIVRDLFNCFEIKSPWPFYLDRCYRTIKAIGKANNIAEVPFVGTKHNALDDAINQAVNLQRFIAYAHVRV